MTAENTESIHAIRPDPLARWQGAVACTTFLFYAIIQCLGYSMWLEIIPTISFSFGYIILLIMLTGLRGLAFLGGNIGSPAFRLGSGVLLFTIFLQLLAYPTIADAGGIDDYSTIVAHTGIIAPLMWLCGEAMGGALGDSTLRRRLWITISIAYCVFACTVLFGVYQGYEKTGLIFFYYQRLDVLGDRIHYNYQILGDGLAVTGLMLIGLARSLPLQIGIYCTTAALLLLSNGRAALYLFLLVAGFSLWKAIRSRSRALVLVVLIVIPTSILFLSRVVFANTDDIIVRRMSGFITAPLEDQSLVARVEGLVIAFDDLEKHWLFGDFMNEWWRDRQRGGYVHNWISFWICYGMFPFAGFCLLAFLVGRIAFRYRQEHQVIAALLFSFGILAIIFAKAYVWVYIWLCLGICVGVEGSIRFWSRSALLEGEGSKSSR